MYWLVVHTSGVGSVYARTLSEDICIERVGPHLTNRNHVKIGPDRQNLSYMFRRGLGVQRFVVNRTIKGMFLNLDKARTSILNAKGLVAHDDETTHKNDYIF